jgi:uncharacterized membrane protein YkgB
MKKQITSLSFLISLLLLISGEGVAQITLSTANFPFVAKAQYQLSDSSTVPALNTSANSFWDLGSVQKKGDFENFFYEEISNNSVFPTATEKSKELVTFGPLSYYQNVYAEKNATGYISLGIGYEQQKKGIGFLSGNNSDTVEVIDQTYVFGTPFTELSFPLTTGTKWAAATKAETNMLFTIALVGYNKTPAQLINYFNSNHDVVSHGTCRIPAKGSPGQTLPVLMLKTETVRVDSFYIDGMPANPFLLGSLGITQGDTIRTYEYRFFRENAGMQALARVVYEDDSYTTVKSASYSSEFDVLSVGDLSINQGILVYPNPIANNSFTVQLNSVKRAPLFSITDVTGKAVKPIVNTVDNSNYQIQLPANTAKGVYFLTVTNNTKTTPIKLLVK